LTVEDRAEATVLHAAGLLADHREQPRR
jgi:hypothetical protein